ncbi:MAG: aspartate aminotransferase family protein [Gammaproteobacteria bacterium]|nr:aspartate aminotransferase family protein [Gammaproteobacteria bacterium]MBT8132995.1 aspartate aminotransferase family protein [Gammaproteobacteria bacterium]NNJ48788.1 aspartate aminotransferase family protein [Gammaproteobacteria bacterium]
MKTYAPLDVTFEHGEGAYLWDSNKNKYLDALCGIAVCGLGHAHPAITRTITEQAAKLLHTSNLYQIENQQHLADQLAEISGMSRTFFSNSGAEANEAAIKIARLYGHQKSIKNPGIIVMENSFHGRTMATLSATGNRKVQAGFEPLVQGFVRAPYNNVEAIESIAENNNDIVAILVEPVQGEGGIRIPDADYLNKLREICDKHDWLLMLDEIQTGMGRTGEWFAFQHNSIQPDVMTLAKALGNGVPIGACLANENAGEIMQPGNHGSTFGGNPLMCATASTVVDTIKGEELIANARDLGKYILNGFSEKLSAIEGVREIRGLGLMIGIELDSECSELVKLALEKNLLINVTAGNVIRLLPPLLIDKQQADVIIDTVSELVIASLHKKAAA